METVHFTGSSLESLDSSRDEGKEGFFSASSRLTDVTLILAREPELVEDPEVVALFELFMLGLRLLFSFSSFCWPSLFDF